MPDAVEIDAPAVRVWELLREEARQGEELGQALVLAEQRGCELLIEVRMGVGFTVQHAYRIERRGDGCQVSAQLRPQGWRWKLSNIFLFGRGRRPLAAASAQGLVNLKQTAESAESAGSTDEAG